MLEFDNGRDKFRGQTVLPAASSVTFSPENIPVSLPMCIVRIIGVVLVLFVGSYIAIGLKN